MKYSEILRNMLTADLTPGDTFEGVLSSEQSIAIIRGIAALEVLEDYGLEVK